MTSQEPSWCSSCIHRDKKNPDKCAAFPGGIPDEILWDMADHRKPWPGDSGIQYKLNPEEQEFADLMTPALKKMAAHRTSKAKKVTK